MRTLIVALIGIGIVGGIGAHSYYAEPVVAENTVATSTTATTTEPQYPEEWVKEAEAAAEAVIQQKKLKKRRSELEASIQELQTELDEVEKELGVY